MTEDKGSTCASTDRSAQGPTAASAADTASGAAAAGVDIQDPGLEDRALFEKSNEPPYGVLATDAACAEEHGGVQEPAGVSSAQRRHEEMEGGTPPRPEGRGDEQPAGTLPGRVERDPRLSPTHSELAGITFDSVMGGGLRDKRSDAHFFDLPNEGSGDETPAATSEQPGAASESQAFPTGYYRFARSAFPAFSVINCIGRRAFSVINGKAVGHSR